MIVCSCTYVGACNKLNRVILKLDIAYVLPSRIMDKLTDADQFYYFSSLLIQNVPTYCFLLLLLLLLLLFIVRTLGYWCFSPGHAMTELAGQGVWSVILTSGTLAPLDSFSSELSMYVQCCQ